MTVAAWLAYYVTLWLDLAEGVLGRHPCHPVIMQSTLGGTLDAGLSPVTGTVAGAIGRRRCLG
jgi:hypothetical protein